MHAVNGDISALKSLLEYDPCAFEGLTMEKSSLITDIPYGRAPPGIKDFQFVDNRALIPALSFRHPSSKSRWDEVPYLRPSDAFDRKIITKFRPLSPQNIHPRYHCYRSLSLDITNNDPRSYLKTIKFEMRFTILASSLLVIGVSALHLPEMRRSICNYLTSNDVSN